MAEVKSIRSDSKSRGQGNRVRSRVEVSKESVTVRGRSWRSKNESRFLEVVLEVVFGS